MDTIARTMQRQTVGSRMLLKVTGRELCPSCHLPMGRSQRPIVLSASSGFVGTVSLQMQEQRENAKGEYILIEPMLKNGKRCSVLILCRHLISYVLEDHP